MLTSVFILQVNATTCCSSKMSDTESWKFGLFIKLFRTFFSIAVKESAESLSFNCECLWKVLILFKAKKLLSTEALVAGITRIRSGNFVASGNAKSSLECKY